MTLCRGIERIAAQPALVFAIESVYVLTLFVPAALTGAAEKIEPSGVERAVIRLRRVAAEGNGIDFLSREETVGNKLLKVDEIRVPGKGRVGLVRRVAVAGPGPSGRICQYFCPAFRRKSANSLASLPSVPTPCGDGSDVICRIIPLARMANASFVC